ncbi:nucleotidyltransferase [Mycobacterium montefiorense]|uniref:nucleotidyltransferase n=1 Tax=Mycobacterium montefiorense TaxID=154654 RepID=UPI0021F383AD|nr:nucleotidyltransferase [Mycobacterium montefiorense]MCV7427494.1 nucleotidyltransferase [Mycobacterium montefiorense]
MAPTEPPTPSPACSAHLREALRRAASALKENGPRFALAGSYALWAYGAPEPSHDVDLVVAEPDVTTAATTLRNAGFAIENPPEDWLFKARIGGTLVDVLHRVNGEPVGHATLDRAEQRDVLAIMMPVLPPTMVLIQKLRSLNEHHCDFARLLPAVRAVRERLDWGPVRSQTAENDYAVAFLVLADRLGLTG